MTSLVISIHPYIHPYTVFPGGSDGKASACNAGDWVQSLGWEDPLENEMACHSSILAWKISWTEEPGWLQSMGLQRVGHDWATEMNWTDLIHPWNHHHNQYNKHIHRFKKIPPDFWPSFCGKDIYIEIYPFNKFFSVQYWIVGLILYSRFVNSFILLKLYTH